MSKMEEANEPKDIFAEVNELYMNLKSEQNHLKNDKKDKYHFEPVLFLINQKFEEIDRTNDMYLKLLVMRSSLYFDWGKLLSTQDTVSLALENLNRALDMLEDLKLNPRVTYLYYRIINFISYFQLKTDHIADSMMLLENAEKLYTNLEGKENMYIFTTDDLFQSLELEKDKEMVKFEKLITNNLQMLGWCYNKMNLNEKSIVYHHIVLRRQLETQDGHIFTWIYKVLRLSSYFFSRQKFREARHHLAAVCVVLDVYELDLVKNRTRSNFISDWQNVHRCYADIGKYWIKYGLYLYEVSRLKTEELSIQNLNEKIDSILFVDPLKSEELDIKKKTGKILNKDISDDLNIGDSDRSFKLKENEENASKLNAKEELKNIEIKEEVEKGVVLEEKTEDDSKDEKVEDKKENLLDKKKEDTPVEDKKVNTNKKWKKSKETKDTGKFEDYNLEPYNFSFPSLNLTDTESQVTCDFIETAEQARLHFLFIQDWIKRSKEYYTVQDHTVEYINLILDLNEAYRYLVMYEANIDTQYNVQSHRAEILESLCTLLKEIRPQCYVSVCVELLHELTQVQVDLISLNMKKIYLSQTASPRNYTLYHEENCRKIESIKDVHHRLGSVRFSVCDLNSQE